MTRLKQWSGPQRREVKASVSLTMLGRLETQCWKRRLILTAFQDIKTGMYIFANHLENLSITLYLSVILRLIVLNKPN